MEKIILLKNFRLVDEEIDMRGSLVIINGTIAALIPENAKQDTPFPLFPKSALVIDGDHLPGGALIMPAFVDLHAHFRDPGFPDKEVLESASMAAAAGGYGTVVCMANTKPVIDTIEKAGALKKRSDALGLVDLYPVMSLTKNMEGKELSGIADLREADFPSPFVRMLSEDGKDVADPELFLKAMNEARRLGIPISCHCDFEGENNATSRAIELGRKAGCHIHIAHVSTKEAVQAIREAKKNPQPPFRISCEAMPHHIALTEEDARALGDESWGRVNPPLRTEADRQAIIEGLLDGTIDAIATDHAPHSDTDKEKGAPGFTGLETAFSVCYAKLCKTREIGLQRLSSLMSAKPARLIGFGNEGPEGRGRLAQGFRGDLVLIDPESRWKADPDRAKSRGKNSPFNGCILPGEILMTLHKGRIVFSSL
ncbi:dihydroorotase [Leadbettera azotonutricia]|uniref:Dihydroorotase (DHOase) n=1 Tax=Leadbettera azotonutricia (strain ATCC BAA-888 / DSM 13862 / ZAS-9) TaxID=545695 RepID=F5Y9E3_LEAAZ|nr:amidohydrolase family protein [Leadbettera azotonutricia]AEF82159.1 dihydroorotase (DHOase) [Leadbettera azotonutricia ZAS-9]